MNNISVSQKYLRNFNEKEQKGKLAIIEQSAFHLPLYDLYYQ